MSGFLNRPKLDVMLVFVLGMLVAKLTWTLIGDIEASSHWLSLTRPKQFNASLTTTAQEFRAETLDFRSLTTTTD